MGSIVITHIAPLSLEESVKLFLSLRWFDDYITREQEITVLHFLQDHYVVWRYKEIGNDKIVIESQFMGDPSMTTEIVVEFKSLGDQTELTVTQTGDTIPKMESEYRSDLYDLRYFGLPRPPVKWNWHAR